MIKKGRPREFDTAEALSNAMIVFWRKGYRGASLEDLTDAMAINKPSLYAAFGDKERLFISAVDHYRSTFIAPAVIELTSSLDLKTGLTIFLRTIAEIVTGNRGNPPGCLIACLLNEEGCESKAIRNKLADLIGGADAAFKVVFEKHSSRLKADLSPMLAAKLLTTTMHGMATRARAGGSRRDLEQIAKAFIECIVK
jgi:TetR/AcrR family transcriptional regulator, copper-responsive repressor